MLAAPFVWIAASVCGPQGRHGASAFVWKHAASAAITADSQSVRAGDGGGRACTQGDVHRPGSGYEKLGVRHSAWLRAVCPGGCAAKRAATVCAEGTGRGVLRTRPRRMGPANANAHQGQVTAIG